MGVTEIKDRLGVSRNRASIIAYRHDFPRPRWVLAMGNVWWADDVERWIAEHRPDIAKPGKA